MLLDEVSQGSQMDHPTLALLWINACLEIFLSLSGSTRSLQDENDRPFYAY